MFLRVLFAMHRIANRTVEQMVSIKKRQKYLVNECGEDAITMDILVILLSKLYEIGKGIYQFA